MSARARIVAWWRQWRWFALAALWLVSYVLCAVGLHLFYPSRRVVDACFLAFQYRNFGWNTSGALPWQLEIGRWMMPIVGSFAALEALLTIFRSRVREMQTRILHDHVVICGLSRKGLLLARACRNEGHRVLVVENDQSHDLLPACEEHGIFVVIGDATQIETLQTARISHAKYLLAVAGDAANAAVVAHARELVTARITARNDAPKLLCAAHIVDSELWRLLRRWELNAAHPLQLQLFNIFDIGARGLLATPTTARTPDFVHRHADAAPRLLVLGAGRLGQRVVLRAARQWLEQQQDETRDDDRVLDSPAVQSENASGENATDENARMQIVWIGDDATAAAQLLQRRYASLSNVCEIHARDLEIGSIAFENAEILNDESQTLSAIYVCLENDARGLAAALSLRGQLERGARPTVSISVCTDEKSGVAALLGHEIGATNSDEQEIEMRAFGVLDYSCRLDFVLRGAGEILARCLHENYLREQGRLITQGENTNLSSVSWDDLPEKTRAANRRQADFLCEQLRLENCDIAPLSDWDATPFAFSPEEIERMAEREHARWTEDKTREGFAVGARDDAQKTNPHLAAWSELPREIQEMNRATVRRLPQFLARAGFQIFRL